MTVIRRLQGSSVQAKSADRTMCLGHSAAVDDLILMLRLEDFCCHDPRPVACRGGRARANATAHRIPMVG